MQIANSCDFMFNIMSIKDFAKAIGKPESTVYSWKQKGDIPLTCFKQIGGTWFVRVTQMQEWIDNN